MDRPAVYIGFDPREADAFAVARHSMRRHMTLPIAICGVVLSELQARGLYYRPTTTRVNGEGRWEMIDQLSIRSDYDGRMSTQHAIARFLIPHIHGRGQALFVDGDILVRGNIIELFRQAFLDRSKAVWCVKHNYQPSEGTKMDGQKQVSYDRKLWSSLMLFNCEHPANKTLTIEMVNTLPGKELHRLCWLDDSEIGEFDPKWNWIPGHSNGSVEPALVHFSLGTPSMPGYENVQWASEWHHQLDGWAQGALNLPG